MNRWLIALAACGGSSAHEPRPALGNEHVATVTRATPPPTISWKDNDFAVTGLPAVARAAEVVVVAVHDGDGGRGYPNLKIEVHDRADHVIQTIAVMTSNEHDTLAPAAKQARVDAANVALATLHGVHDLVAMHPLEVTKPGDAAPHFAIGDALDVDFSGDHLHVFHHNSDHSLAVRDSSSWLAPSTKGPAGTCSNPAFLANAFHTAGIAVVVAEIGYTGTDTCWEPGHQFHVVTW